MIDAPELRSRFADYKSDAHNWVTLSTGEFYPDILVDACLLYEPVLQLFGRLVRTSESSERLFMQIADVSETWMRIQLARVFKRYVSPGTPVEMLKKSRKRLLSVPVTSMSFVLFQMYRLHL